MIASTITDLWLAFFAFWLAAGLYTRLTRKSAVRGESVLSTVLQWSFYGAAVQLALFTDYAVLQRPLFTAPAAFAWVGVGVLIASLGSAVWARILLGRNWSGTIQRVAAHVLVVSGPYRLVRNPIYGGILAGFYGTVIAHPTIGSLCGFCALLAFYLWKVPAETRFLESQFGEEYRQYERSTWALFPYVY